MTCEQRDKLGPLCQDPEPWERVPVAPWTMGIDEAIKVQSATRRLAYESLRKQAKEIVEFDIGCRVQVLNNHTTAQRWIAGRCGVVIALGCESNYRIVKLDAFGTRVINIKDLRLN